MLDAYSQGGERQMLAIGRALMSRPKLLLLDELSLGLAPLIVQDITRAVGVGARGRVRERTPSCLKDIDYGYVLEMGRFVAEGDAERLMNDERLAATYLRSKSCPRDHAGFIVFSHSSIKPSPKNPPPSINPPIFGKTPAPPTIERSFDDPPFGRQQILLRDRNA